MNAAASHRTRAVYAERRITSPARSRPILALLCAAAAWGPALTAQSVPPDHAVRVDSIFARWDSVTSPGCAVGVTVNGLTVLERAYGMADLEHGVPNTPGTVFEAGSVSKQFTAAAVILLEMEGRLSLDDDVRTYVPELPDYGHTITLRHLMTHTSGLRDWGSVAAISGWGRERRTHDHDWVLDILSRQRALNFPPGFEYSYSNSGYNLLAIIVRRVAGKPFAEFSRERIFQPLGMRHTQWRDDYRRLVPGRSSAYNPTRDGGWRINRPIEHVHGNGGLLTTVGDLAIWNQALTDGRLGGQEFLARMHRTGALRDGSPIVYAAGLRIADFQGVPSVTHTGATAGYRAFLGRYPDQGLSVAMLCNAANVPTGATGAAVARVYLGDALTPPAEPEPVALPAGTLERLEGLYRDPFTGQPKLLRAASDGTLRDGTARLIPVSDTRFRVGASERFYVFHPSEDGGRPWFRVESWEYTDRRYEPVEPWEPTPEELEGLVGTYHSAEAETTFVVRVHEQGGLELWQRPGRTRRLLPVYRDAFRSAGGLIRFRRTGLQQADTLSLSLSRVYDTRFVREAAEGTPGGPGTY